MMFQSNFDYEHTPQECLDAVRYDGTNISLVPDSLKTSEMCRIAIETSRLDGISGESILRHIPFSDVCL